MSINHEDMSRALPSLANLEKHVCQAWSAILNRDDLRTDSDFFALGGDSYQVVQVVTVLEQSLGFEIPVRFLFQQPTTVGGLARRIETMGPHPDAVAEHEGEGFETGEL